MVSTLRNLVFRGIRRRQRRRPGACVAQDQGPVAWYRMPHLNNVWATAADGELRPDKRPVRRSTTPPSAANRAKYSGGARLIAAGFVGGTNEAQLRNANLSAPNSAQGSARSQYRLGRYQHHGSVRLDLETP